MIAFIVLASTIGPSGICKEEVLPKPSFEHVLASKHVFLDTLELEDHSTWEIAPPDTYKVVGWEAKDIVVLTPHSSWFSVYKYQFSMTNLTRQSYVRVNFTSHPADYQKAGPLDHLS